MRRLSTDTSGLFTGQSGCIRMAFQTKEPDLVAFEQLGIGGSVRSMARLATLDLQRCMFIHERALLVGMALGAGHVGADPVADLFLLKSTVLVMTI